MFFLLIGNEIGDDGVSYIAESLQVNNTLTNIVFWGEKFVYRSVFYCLSVFFFSKQTTTLDVMVQLSLQKC